MFKLKRLKIDRFRNVSPGTELVFNDGFNVLLGQNGSGKTTLLKLISMIVRSDLSELARVAFSIGYELTPGDDTAVLRVKVANERGAKGWAPILEAEVVSSDHQVDTRIRYDSGWSMDDQDLGTRVEDADCLDPGMPILLFDRVGALQQFLPRAWQAYRFDESLDVFRENIGNPSFPGEFDWFNLGGGEKQFVLGFNPWERFLPPPEMIELVDRWLPGSTSELLMEDRDLPFLRKVVELMGFASAQARFDLLELSKERGQIRLGNLSFRFRRDNGDIIAHDSLSYGQKRMLIFYYYLALNPAVIIADEIVNGLHHQWITACVDDIGERQAFLTSQNPLLLDYLPFTSAEEAQRTFILCARDLHEGRRRFRWYNMAPQDAASFYRAYEQGIQHVGDILRTKGLW